MGASAKYANIAPDNGFSMLNCYQSDPWKQTSDKFIISLNTFSNGACRTVANLYWCHCIACLYINPGQDLIYHAVPQKVIINTIKHLCAWVCTCKWTYCSEYLPQDVALSIPRRRLAEKLCCSGTIRLARHLLESDKCCIILQDKASRFDNNTNTNSYVGQLYFIEYK